MSIPNSMEILTAYKSYHDASRHDATYSCYLTNTWSEDRHPIGYDAIKNLAHWSRPVLVSHDQRFDLWGQFEFASKGVQDVAETGDTSELEAWLRAHELVGIVANVVVGENQINAVDPMQEFPPIHLSEDWPLISTISKLAPSSDWFTGIPGFSPISEDGFWYEHFTIATFPWDAGTKQGETYSYSSSDEPVQHPIQRLDHYTVPASGILLDPTKTTVLPVAEWSCLLWPLEPGVDFTEWPSMSHRDVTDFPTVADVTEGPSMSHRDVTDFPTVADVTEGPSMSWTEFLKTEGPTDFPEGSFRSELPQGSYREFTDFPTAAEDKTNDSCLPFLSPCTVDDNCCSGICVLGTCCKPERSDSHRISHGEGIGIGERTPRNGGHIRRLEGDAAAEEVSDEKTAGLLRGFQR